MTSRGVSTGVHARRTDAVTKRHEAADLIIGYLEQLGVEYVFGVPGGAIEPLFSALARSQRRGTVRPVVARHESGAAFMADGYARETGRMGVCCATTGPGATNMITGVASAYQQNVPLLVVTAQTPLESFGIGAIQESSCTAVNTVGMYQYCTRYNSLVSHPQQLERKLVNAIITALRPPRGPSHLSIPMDILRTPIADCTPAAQLASLLQGAGTMNHEIPGELFELAENARRIVIIVGEGCHEATESIIGFADTAGALMVTTPLGKGLINSFHPLYRGVCGLAGHDSAKRLITDPGIDLIIAAGSSLDQQTSLGWDERPASAVNLVHIDSVAANFAYSPTARLHVNGDIRLIFDALIKHLRQRHSNIQQRHNASTNPEDAPAIIRFERRNIPRRISTTSDLPSKIKVSLISEERRANDRRRSNVESLPVLSRYFALENERKYRSDAVPIKPQRLMYDLSRLFPPNTRFLADNGNSFFWAIHYLHPFNRRVSGQRSPNDTAIRTSMGFASMGWAIGSSVGTALANPAVPVVCIVGDGSFLMSGMELSVAVSEELTVVFVILNDCALGTVKHGQRMRGSEQIAFEIPEVDFAMLAKSLGAEGITIKSPDDMARLDISTICKNRGPTVLDVHIDAEEAPPISDRIKMLEQLG